MKNCLIPNYDRYLNIRKDLVNEPHEFPELKEDHF